MALVSEYIRELNSLYKTHIAKELSYRIELHKLIKDYMGSSFVVVNEPEHIDCGAPDLVIQKSGIPVAYIETKNIGDGDLDGLKKNKEQFDRYKAGLDTIVFTDYLDFHLYKDEKLQLIVQLAFVQNDKIVLNEGAVEQFQALLDKLLYDTKAQTITSPKKLAVLMANKAKLIAEVIKLNLQKSHDANLGLAMQMQAFKNILNKDIDEEKFADLYAQTITYGLFVARIHDNNNGEFTRDKAMKLIPQTNPFLRELFQYIAGINIRKSIAWIVDDLVTIFDATNVEKLRKNFEKEFQRRDPMIHFYEDFLFQYNPAAKKKYGVYYTPQPVVEFIVTAVNDILKNVFNIDDGLADTCKVNDQHRVQILDPATGTGTFLAEVVGRIKEQIQPAVWPIYVREHLIHRIYGFEYMMAPYTIAHIKLDMLINLWGKDKFSDDTNDRVKVYLTNSLIQDDLKTKIAFAEMLAKEANEANDIKQNAPVMVMIGNPPYAVSSNNKGPEFRWIENLLKDYKKNLNERNIQPLSDDYIKFIRLAQYYVERTGEGIVAYISNNSFLDGRIHRQMRRELMRCFDDIYILNLHGNNRKKETAPDGSLDENVFAIMQGVSINIFVKKKKGSDEPATIHSYDLYGSRKEKYTFLSDNSLSSIPWHRIQPQEPDLYFVPKDFNNEDEYKMGFKVDELMKVCSSGVKTHHDSILVSFTPFQTLFNQQYAYRPFDVRYINYDLKKVVRHRYEKMHHMMHPNLALLVKKGFPYQDRAQCFATQLIADMRAWTCSGMQGSEMVFPLYLYPSESELDFDSKPKPNQDETIWRTIENWVKYGQACKPLTMSEQNGELGFDAVPDEPHFLAPEDIFDYIYGVLHSPLYREKYKEFLKVDFPRIPYPKNANEFEHYKGCGHLLRELHLMHNVPKSNVIFEGEGDFEIKKIRWDDNRVYINETQYFSNVPQTAWEMYIGGYQPAQKWLKDRKDRTLNTMDILHYENIITILLATKETMDKMDDPSAQVDELKKKVANLEHQLQESLKSAQIINYGTINNDNSKHITIK